MSEVNNQKIDEIIIIVRRWISNVVIGLNLCPFSKPVYADNLIRYSVSLTSQPEEFLTLLESEILLLTNSNPLEIETSLLITPNLFKNFLDQNDFLDRVEHLLSHLKLDGIIQIANFHPEFQFANRNRDDITNYVNRSPYPILHLLREESISRVVDLHPNINSIYKNNKKTMRKLGYEGIRDLF
jgi:hypothetical protein